MFAVYIVTWSTGNRVPGLDRLLFSKDFVKITGTFTVKKKQQDNRDMPTGASELVLKALSKQVNVRHTHRLSDSFTHVHYGKCSCMNEL